MASEKAEEARKWIDAVQTGTWIGNVWKLESLEKRLRAGPDGKTVQRPTRMRRFLKGIPAGYVLDAVAYLNSLAPYRDIVFNGETVYGSWMPTRTIWRRDEQMTVDRMNSVEGTYTLIQDLIDETSEGEESSSTSMSCSETVVTTWHWDEDSPGDASDYYTGCEQGVSYAVTQVNMDRDTGRFDWALVKRVANTQHSGPVTVECGPDFTVVAETWDNVYGSASDGYKARFCGSDEMSDISVPGCGQNGEKNQVQVTENPDCTLKIVVTSRRSSPMEYGWTDGTSCQPRTVTHSFNLADKPSVPVPGVGDSVSATVKRNEDGTWDSQVTVTPAPSEDTTSWTDGSACHRRTVMKISNARTKPELPTTSAGDTLNATLQRNQDCTWDASFEIRSSPDEKTIEWDQGTECRPEKVTVWHNMRTQPAVPKPSAGSTVSASIRRNDDCTYDGQVTVRAPSTPHETTWTHGSELSSETVSARQNFQTEPVVPVPSAGSTVSASIRRNDDCTYDSTVSVRETKERIVSFSTGSSCSPVTERVGRNVRTLSLTPVSNGKSVSASVSINDDGTYDFRESVGSRKSDSVTWSEGSACRPVSASHVFGATSVSIPPVPASGTVTANVSRNQDCTYDYTYRVTSPATSAQLSWEDGTASATRKVTSYQNVSSVPDVPKPAVGQEVSASIRKTDDCTYDGQVAVTTSTQYSAEWDEGSTCRGVKAGIIQFARDTSALPKVPDAGTLSATVRRNVDGTFDMSYRVTQPSQASSITWTDGTSCASRTVTSYQNAVSQPSVPSPTAGTTVSASIRKNDDCTFDGQVAVTTSSTGTMEWSEGTCRETTKVSHVSRSQTYSSFVPKTDDGVKVSANVTRNEDCTYDVTTRTTTPKKVDTDWVKWDSVTKTANGTYKYHHGVRVFYNLDSIPVPPRGSNVSMDIRPNEYCKYDGQIAYTDLYDWSVDSSSTSGDGGIRNGEVEIEQTVLGSTGRLGKLKHTYEVVKFLGSGNEGTEADYIIRGYLPIGNRAYLKPKPGKSVVSWT